MSEVRLFVSPAPFIRWRVRVDGVEEQWQECTSASGSRPLTLAMPCRGSDNSEAAKDLAAAKARNPDRPCRGAAGTRVGRRGPCSAAGEESDGLNGFCTPPSGNLEDNHDEAAPRSAQELWVANWTSSKEENIGCDCGSSFAADARSCALQRNASAAEESAGSSECGIKELGEQVCWGMRRGAAEAETPVAKWQVGPAGGQAGQWVIWSSVDLQRQSQAMQHAAVVLGCEAVRAGGRARNRYYRWYYARGLAQYGSNMEVGECGEKLEESVVLRGEGVKARSNELISAERGCEDLQALLVCGQAGVANPDVHMVGPGSGGGGSPAARIPAAFQTRVIDSSLKLVFVVVLPQQKRELRLMA
ncbi:unnamed protein product [Symbiodinium microadriaticum]|nr:unnamed protein product [Symbiodinium microadriaticum]